MQPPPFKDSKPTIKSGKYSGHIKGPGGAQVFVSLELSKTDEGEYGYYVDNIVVSPSLVTKKGD